MQFIVSGQRIAVENFVTGKLYTILWKNDTQVTLTCISIGADCVVFQGEAPLNLFTLTMQNADTIDTIEPTQLGTTNYNNLINKPSINGVDLIGNKTSAALGIRDVPTIIESDEGKILTANSDGTYTWQPAPSSGTMDYTQLNNKPQINSVTLTGNVSLADLGAAAAADIPTTPADIGAEPAITSENMLDADLVDDTSSTHKFATSAQLAQIATNENNISKFHKVANVDIYFSETEPTGDITSGSYWISTQGNKIYSGLIADNPICAIDTNIDTLNLSNGLCTRYIKKIVLDGSETWYLQSINTHGIANFNTDNDYLTGISADRSAINSHFYQTTSPIADVTEPCFSISPTSYTLYLKVLSSVASTPEALKTWLAAQYAVGTPVTVWYILETATTETITVPAGLTGTESGYLIQDGTPTPTLPIYPTSNSVIIWH